MIEFVDHRYNGPASKRVRDAKPGSKLGVIMRTEVKELHNEADWYLFVGNSTAIPAIASVLETLSRLQKETVSLKCTEKKINKFSLLRQTLPLNGSTTLHLISNAN